MTSLILKTTTANPHHPSHPNAPDRVEGHINTGGSTQRIVLKTKPGLVYRLVDAASGEVFTAQSMVRKGTALQVVVDAMFVLELEQFFPVPVDANATTQPPSSYLFSFKAPTDTFTSTTQPITQHGLISSDTPIAYSRDQMDVLWVPGLPVASVADPQALGIAPLAAISTGSFSPLSLGQMAALVAIPGVGAGSNHSPNNSLVPAKVNLSGKIFAGPVVSNGNNDLTVAVYDSSGHELSKSSANDDGSFLIPVAKTYSGVMLLKAFDKNTLNTDKPQHLDESTQQIQTLPTLIACFYFDGHDATINITPLTSVAAMQVGFDSDGNAQNTQPLDKNTVESANTLIAKAFGIPAQSQSQTPVFDLVSAEVITTVDPTPGLKPNQYGLALNLLSHLVLQQTGNSVTEVLKLLAQQIQANNAGSPEISSPQVQSLLNQAALSALAQAPSSRGDLDTLLETLTGSKVNMAPAISGTRSALSFIENDAPQFIFSNLSITDSDNTTLASATVSITDGFKPNEDVLALNNPAFGNITGSYNTATGVLTLTSANSSATLAQWAAALQAVTYQNTSDNPSTATRTLRVVVNDGLSNSANFSNNVNITAVNDAPVLGMTQTSLKAYSGRPCFLPTGMALNDPDAGDGNMQLTLKVTEANGSLGKTLTYGLTQGVTLKNVTNTNEYNFQGTMSALRNWLNSPNLISFTPANAFSGWVTVSATLSDMGNSGGAAQTTSTSTYTIAVDNTPILQEACTNWDNTKVVLIYQETLHANSANTASTDFVIDINGVAYTPTAVSVLGKTVLLTIPSTVFLNPEDNVQASYTPSSPNPAIQDVYGNDAAGFGKVHVTHFRGDNTAPVLQKAELSEDGYRIILYYNELLAPATGNANMFSAISGNAAPVAPTDAYTEGKNMVVLKFASPFNPQQPLKVTYNPPLTFNTSDTNSAIQDGGGMDALGLSDQAVFTDAQSPLNTVLNKTFTVTANTQVDVIGLGLTDTLGANNLGTMTVKLQLTNMGDNSLWLLNSALMANHLFVTGGTLIDNDVMAMSGINGASLTLSGTQSELNTFLHTAGNFRYKAPSVYGPLSQKPSDVLTITSTWINPVTQSKRMDIDSVGFAPLNPITGVGAEGIGLGLGPIYLRQGVNGCALGAKGQDNLLSIHMFDVLDHSLSAGSPSGSLYSNYTITISGSAGLAGPSTAQSNYFFNVAAPTTAITSFTLADVNDHKIGFYYNGAQTLPTFTATVSKAGGQQSKAAESNLIFLQGNSSSDAQGGVLYYGDGSGRGGSGGYVSGSGVSGAGNDDRFTGSEFDDLMFGDGSGGGEGPSNGSGGAMGIAGRGGGGNDSLVGGAGNDLMFGDGFAGSERPYMGSQYLPGLTGGYGGGGAGGSFNNPPTPGSIGGGASGYGVSVPSSNSAPTFPSYKGQTNSIGIAGETSAYTYSNGSYIAAPGAGVTADGAAMPSSSEIKAFLDTSLYQKVLKDLQAGITGSDARVFNQVMGDGADSLRGDDGNDWIMGGYGNDTLIGGQGQDVLWGRGGGEHQVNIQIVQGLAPNPNATPFMLGVTETATVVFSDGLHPGESVTVGGLTLTAQSEMTAENVASAFANLAEGTNLLNPVSGMVFNTSGSLITGWTSSAVSQTQYFSSSNHTPYHAVVTFTSALPNTDVNDLTAHVNLLDNDVFIWNGGDAGPMGATDVIKDFVAWNGTQGDTLNIANLLMGYTHGQSNLSAWVSVVTGQASPNGTLNSTQISIDVDGAGSGTVVQTIWLEGVALNTTDVSVLQFHGVLIA